MSAMTKEQIRDTLQGLESPRLDAAGNAIAELRNYGTPDDTWAIGDPRC